MEKHAPILPSGSASGQKGGTRHEASSRRDPAFAGTEAKSSDGHATICLKQMRSVSVLHWIQINQEIQHKSAHSVIDDFCLLKWTLKFPQMPPPLNLM